MTFSSDKLPTTHQRAVSPKVPKGRSILLPTLDAGYCSPAFACIGFVSIVAQFHDRHFRYSREESDTDSTFARSMGLVFMARTQVFSDSDVLESYVTTKTEEYHCR